MEWSDVHAFMLARLKSKDKLLNTHTLHKTCMVYKKKKKVLLIQDPDFLCTPDDLQPYITVLVESFCATTIKYYRTSSDAMEWC